MKPLIEATPLSTKRLLQERQRGGRSVGSEVGDLIAFLFFFPPFYASRFERAIRRSRNVAREASRRCKRQLDRQRIDKETANSPARRKLRVPNVQRAFSARDLISRFNSSRYRPSRPLGARG